MSFLETLLEDFYTEDVEKHDELNPKLFGEDQKLRSEVVDKINQIVDLFVDTLKEDEITINIEDIILVGSNVSYNYTKDSDLDIHILANVDAKDTDRKLLYGAYRSLFNKNMDIDFYGISVEIYVECDDTPLHSNGIYSVKDNEWIKEPDKEEIPEIDYALVEEQVKPFIDRYNSIKENPTSDNITDLINDIYEERKKGMAEPEAEYSISNLVFKEFRNQGYLDNLKDLRYETLSNELSLEEGYRQDLWNRVIDIVNKDMEDGYKRNGSDYVVVEPFVDVANNSSISLEKALELAGYDDDDRLRRALNSRGMSGREVGPPPALRWRDKDCFWQRLLNSIKREFESQQKPKNNSNSRFYDLFRDDEE